MKDEMFTHFESPAAVMVHASKNWNKSWTEDQLNVSQRLQIPKR